MFKPLYFTSLCLMFVNLNLPSSLSLSLALSFVAQMFLTVYLSNNDQHFTEVPVTPDTLCRDVVELCKEPGEMDCHLSEMWRGSGECRQHYIQCEQSAQQTGEESHDVILWN